MLVVARQSESDWNVFRHWSCTSCGCGKSPKKVLTIRSLRVVGRTSGATSTKPRYDISHGPRRREAAAQTSKPRRALNPDRAVAAASGFERATTQIGSNCLTCGISAVAVARSSSTTIRWSHQHRPRSGGTRLLRIKDGAAGDLLSRPPSRASPPDLHPPHLRRGRCETSGRRRTVASRLLNLVNPDATRGWQLDRTIAGISPRATRSLRSYQARVV